MKRYIKAAIMDVSKEPYEVRLELAEDHNTDSETLSQIASSAEHYEPSPSKAIDLIVAIAENPNTSTETLGFIMDDKYFSSIPIIRQMVVGNSNVPLPILEEFATSFLSQFKFYAAENPSLPKDLLVQLSKDKDSDVRTAVVWNKNLTADIALSLISDPSTDVREELASIEDKLPIETVLTILSSLWDDPVHDVRWAVATNSKCPTDILHKLVFDDDYSVRLFVTMNNNTSIEDLITLSNDSNNEVSKHAREKLHQRGIEI